MPSAMESEALSKRITEKDFQTKDILGRGKKK